MCVLPNFSVQELEWRRQKKEIVKNKVDDETEKVIIELAFLENLI
jgi:hypothetical protein